jgi:hypothetical protein
MIYQHPLLVLGLQKTMAGFGRWHNAGRGHCSWILSHVQLLTLPQDVCTENLMLGTCLLFTVDNACSRLLIFLKFQDVKQLENNTAIAV